MQKFTPRVVICIILTPRSWPAPVRRWNNALALTGQKLAQRRVEADAN
jgi:hypothetical protein